MKGMITTERVRIRVTGIGGSFEKEALEKRDKQGNGECHSGGNNGWNSHKGEN